MFKFGNLFARSPFGDFQEHMAKTKECYSFLPALFDAAFAGDGEEVDRLFRRIHETEHEADLLKNRIRGHLPKRLLTPVDRRDVLKALSAVDDMADVAEDIAMLVRIRPTRFPDFLQDPIRLLLKRSLATCEAAGGLVGEMDVLVATSFRGAEAQRVRGLIEETNQLEHESDVAGYRLACTIFAHETELDPVDIYMFNDISRALGGLANAAQKVAKQFGLFLAEV